LVFNKNMISFKEFQKIDLRVAKVIKAEKVESSKNLLKLEVDLGKEKRQIIAGIREYYRPEDLVGREIVVIVNLEPRVVFGLESQGMLLAAGDKEPVLLIPDKEVPPGSKIH